MTCSVESREDAVARLDEEVAELASKISVDSSNLGETIAKYNESCKAGIDEFGRAKENLKAFVGNKFLT